MQVELFFSVGKIQLDRKVGVTSLTKIHWTELHVAPFHPDSVHIKKVILQRSHLCFFTLFVDSSPEVGINWFDRCYIPLWVKCFCNRAPRSHVQSINFSFILHHKRWSVIKRPHQEIPLQSYFSQIQNPSLSSSARPLCIHPPLHCVHKVEANINFLLLSDCLLQQNWGWSKDFCSAVNKKHIKVFIQLSNVPDKDARLGIYDLKTNWWSKTSSIWLG